MRLSKDGERLGAGWKWGLDWRYFEFLVFGFA
jgi:hypothetical protein